jgi:hypothetical protein
MNKITIRMHNEVKEMKTVGELIKELQKYPRELRCYVYEGECFGVVIIDENGKEKGFIECGYEEESK